MAKGTCPACKADFTAGEKCVEMKSEITSALGVDRKALLYCPDCSKKILMLPFEDVCDCLDNAVSGLIGRPVAISEDLVREIAQNLGATQHLEEALVERIFGKDWTGEIPPGARMNEYQNRDRLVVFVAMKLKDLWTFEANS